MFHPYRIIPGRPRFGGGAGKGPKLDSLLIGLGKVSQALDHANWVRVKSRFANMEMLNQVEGNVADEWLKVDRQPGLALGSLNISGVKAGGEQIVGRRWLRERL
jgi:hypothetical protein